MREITEFHIVPSKEIQPGKQVLLVEHEHRRIAQFEGSSDLADAYVIWALSGMQNDAGNTPILLVNQDDFDRGIYGNFSAPQTE